MSNSARDCVVKELASLINDIETSRENCYRSFNEPTVYPDFLGPKGARFKRDLDTIPLITFIPVFEVRPTSIKKVLKEHVPMVGRILFPSADSTHKYPPWNRPTARKSVEIRAGTVLSDCWCENYNGLQDRCDRTGCHGTCLCLMPRPQCEPGKLKKLQPPDPNKQALARQSYLDSFREKRPYCCHPNKPLVWKEPNNNCSQL